VGAQHWTASTSVSGKGPVSTFSCMILVDPTKDGFGRLDPTRARLIMDQSYRVLCEEAILLPFHIGSDFS